MNEQTFAAVFKETTSFTVINQRGESLLPENERTIETYLAVASDSPRIGTPVNEFQDYTEDFILEQVRKYLNSRELRDKGNYLHEAGDCEIALVKRELTFASSADVPENEELTIV